MLVFQLVENVQALFDPHGNIGVFVGVSYPFTVDRIFAFPRQNLKVEKRLLMDEEPTCCVVDNGSGSIKAGFAGSESPECVFPSIIGRPRHKAMEEMLKKKDSQNVQSIVAHWSDHSISIKTLIEMIQDFVQFEHYFIGNNAKSKRGVLRLKYPVEKGIVTNWDDMELLWRYTFEDELRFDPAEVPIFMTETPLNPKANREKTTEILFETFNTPSFYLTTDAVLGLYNCGKTTGISLDCGDSVAHSVPVYEGYSLSHGVQRFEVGGRDITYQLMKILTERGYCFTTSAEREIVGEIKEKMCYVALDYDDELEKSDTSSELERKYKLPDGQLITIGAERFRAPECLFKPNLIGKSYPGIHRYVYETIGKIDHDLKRDLYQNVVITGGSTMFPGFAERLQKEIKNVAPQGTEVHVVSSPDRKYAAWRGGSIISSLSTFQEMWITGDEYDEIGPSIVHRKCY